MLLSTCKLVHSPVDILCFFRCLKYRSGCLMAICAPPKTNVHDPRLTDFLLPQFEQNRNGVCRRLCRRRFDFFGFDYGLRRRYGSFDLLELVVPSLKEGPVDGIRLL